MVCKDIFLMISLYITLSICEYLIHRYLMHNKENSLIRYIYGTDHINHHKDVLQNMSLKKNYNKNGLFMNSNHTFIITLVVFLVFYFIINIIFKRNITNIYILILSFFIGLFYRFMWNYLHPRFHKIKQCKKNIIFNYLYNNHKNHHLQKGKRKGNFNIIFIGADYLFGTYNTEVKN